MIPPHFLTEVRPAAHRYARALTRDPAAAEDLLAAATLRAYEKAHLYQPDTDLRAWFFTLLRNLHIQRTRYAAREAFFFSPLDDSLPAPTDPLLAVQLAEVRAALARLPAPMQRIVILATLGHTHQTMAAMERIPVGTVRSRLSRARAALREARDA